MIPVCKLCISVALIFFQISDGYGQKRDSIIRDIQESFRKINNDRTLKIIKLENEEFLPQATDGGCSLTGYFKGDTVYKMKVWIGLSYGIKQFEYYFKNGNLFFIYEKEEDFPYDEKEGTLVYTKVKLAFEGRYYLNRGKIIDVKKRGEKRLDANYSAFLKDLIAESKSYEKLLRNRFRNGK